MPPFPVPSQRARRLIAPVVCETPPPPEQIFVQCLDRFRRYAELGPDKPHLQPATASGWCRNKEEYLADFVLTAKRTLGEHTAPYQVFRAHFLLGASAAACSRKFEIDLWDFHRERVRIEERLGKAFAEPRGLWVEYFTYRKRRSAA